MFRSKRILSITAAVLSVSALTPVVPVAAAEAPLASMLKDIKPGSSGSKPSDLTQIGDLLYFTAADGRRGREPWISDGTSVGTRMIKNISPGSYSSNPRDYTLVGDHVFFTAQDGNGRELWVTDGTSLGTIRVKDIRPGDRSSKPSNLTAVGNTLFLTADDGVSGQELWKSDGTEIGTVLVADIQSGRTGSDPTELTAFNGALHFVIPDPAPGAMSPCCVLFRSDGTAQGTGAVADRDGNGIARVTELTVSGSLLYFSGSDPNNMLRGDFLWRTDGTALGTKAVSTRFNDVSQLTDVAGKLFFIAENSELWTSTGSKATTLLVKPVDSPSQLTASGNYLYYTTVGTDLMQPIRISDGTARPEDSWAAANWGNGYAYGNLTDVAGTLFVSFGHNTDPENQLGWDLLYMDCSLHSGDCTQYLWQKRAVPLRDGWPILTNVHDLTAVGSSLFFVAADVDGEAGVELWRYAP